MDNTVNSVKNIYMDKIYLTMAMSDYKNEDLFDDMLFNTEDYRDAIIEGFKSGVKPTVVEGGYGKMPKYYKLYNFSEEKELLGYGMDEHRLMCLIGAYISTFVGRGVGIKAKTIMTKCKIRLPELKHLIELIGEVYGLKWIKEYSEKENRNTHHIALDRDLVIRNEIKFSNKNKNATYDNFDDTPRDENGDFVDTDEFQEYIELFA